jgi:hypothetical protein
MVLRWQARLQQDQQEARASVTITPAILNTVAIIRATAGFRTLVLMTVEIALAASVRPLVNSAPNTRSKVMTSTILIWNPITSSASASDYIIDIM